MTAAVLNLLQRSDLRKAAIDAGFDLLANRERWVEAASSHAPLEVTLAMAPPHIWLGLSMDAVARALGLTPAPAPVDMPDRAAWLSLPDVPTLDEVLGRAWALSRSLPNALEKRFEAALASLPSTEREAAVRRRVGQGLFREGLMLLWGRRCAVTGLSVPELLRASHAKPWADSTDAERLDVYNGLLLAAHLDAAFDSGLMSLAEDGRVLWSERLDGDALVLLTVPGKAKVPLDKQHQPYLAWHRANVFK